MDSLREVVRVQQAKERGKKRNFLQDSSRNLGLILDVKTPKEMRNSAEMLSKKSAITAELLIAVKNGLLLGNDVIKAFLEVNSALPTLLRLFSVSGGDARLQILAAHCLCNLALGGPKISTRLAKMAGPYLVMNMEGMNPLLTEASLWTVGNISLFEQPFQILHAQGAYIQAAKLLATTSDPFVRSAAAFCLIRALKNNFSFFNDDEYVLMCNHTLSVTTPDSAIFLLCSLMAHQPSAATLMTQRGLHSIVLEDVIQSDIDVTCQLSIIRILGNLVTDQSGQVAAAVLQNPKFAEFIKRQVYQKTAVIGKETNWLLGNLVYHPNDEIKSLAAQLGIISWIA